jgi:hypothetical protein
MELSTTQWLQQQIIDAAHQNAPVAQFSFPGNWKAASQVNWKYENISQPVTIYSIAYNPNGVDWVEMLPIESFYWLQPDYGFDQPGSFKFGQFFLQPMRPEDAMVHWIVPRFRGNRQNMRVKQVQSLPQLPQQLKIPGQQVPLYGVVAKIEYLENAKAIEEEVYGVMVVQPGIPSYGAGGTITQTNWGFMRLFCFRAEKGQLDENRNTYWQIMQSIQTNPDWEQKIYNPIMQQMQVSFQQHLQAGYDQINAATQISRMISAQNNSFYQQQEQNRNADWQAFEQKRLQENQANGTYTKEEAFGDAMMGQEAYHDPYYQYGSKHSGYNQYVWTNSQGEYQYSNDANFDPNLGATQSWTLMQKKNTGG